MKDHSPYCRMPDTWQTPDERRAKYALCRSCGVPRGWAVAMRDWRQVTLDNFIQRFYDSPQSISKPPG